MRIWNFTWAINWPKQNAWLEPYITFNTQKRTLAAYDFEKDFFKQQAAEEELKKVYDTILKEEVEEKTKR